MIRNLHDVQSTLIIFLIGSSLTTAFLGYVVFYLNQDFEFYAAVPCDPLTESCYVGDGENTPQLYKNVSQKAYAAPACDEWSGACPYLSCFSQNESCTEEFCEAGSEAECHGPIGDI